LQRGINRTPYGGELHILDSGDYGVSANINKSMTISGNGNTVFLAQPITVNQPSGAVVALRDLKLNGKGAVQGVWIRDSALVHVERCVIFGFFQDGIRADGIGVSLYILDSILRDNANSGLLFSGGTRLVIDNSRFEANGAAGLTILSGHAAISRSIIAGNIHGMHAIGAIVNVMSTMVVQNNEFGVSSGEGGVLTVESSHLQKNTIGFNVYSGATGRVSSSTVTGNATGIYNSGVVETFGNNVVRGNSTNVGGPNALTTLGGI
jgi:hypothetical protein